MSTGSEVKADTIRLDKWLWQARFVKSRSLAKALVQGRKVRVSGAPVSKASRSIQPGDILTFPFSDGIMICRVLALGTRRGPAPEAQMLYETLEDPREKSLSSTGKAQLGDQLAPAQRERGSGRPTKKQRRDMEKWHQ